MPSLKFWDEAIEKVDLGPLKPAYEKAKTREKKLRICEAAYYRVFGVAGPRLFGVTAECAALMAEGVSPKEQVPWLSSSDAHEWASQDPRSGEPNPVIWSWDRLMSEYKLSGPVPESGEVVKWYRRMLSSPRRKEAVTRHREGLGGYGSAVSRADELSPIDLSDSVSRTLAAATARLIKDQWDGDDELQPKRSWEKDLPPGVFRIRTASGLIKEGLEQSHCVGQYCHRVADGEFEIFSIRIKDESATFSVLANSNRVDQCVGKANVRASEFCLKIARESAKIIQW